mmetsp:Transcript_25915/g.46973  ORF Transcript_25915/g.46973 Transcript_25915/m.46973 type:complete len:245 (-) Transcript_25915:145-879(-)
MLQRNPGTACSGTPHKLPHFLVIFLVPKSPTLQHPYAHDEVPTTEKWKAELANPYIAGLGGDVEHDPVLHSKHRRSGTYDPVQCGEVGKFECRELGGNVARHRARGRSNARRAALRGAGRRQPRRILARSLGDGRHMAPRGTVCLPHSPVLADFDPALIVLPCAIVDCIPHGFIVVLFVRIAEVIYATTTPPRAIVCHNCSKAFRRILPPIGIWLIAVGVLPVMLTPEVVPHLVREDGVDGVSL